MLKNQSVMKLKPLILLCFENLYQCADYITLCNGYKIGAFLISGFDSPEKGDDFDLQKGAKDCSMTGGCRQTHPALSIDFAGDELSRGKRFRIFRSRG